MKIPGPSAWAGYEKIPNGKHAHDLWSGKSLDEMQTNFSGGRSVQRADELLWMPRPAFQFYVLAFAQYLLSEDSAGDSKAASSFLRFLIAREQRDPGSVSHIFGQLSAAIGFVAASQPRFDAGHGIHGNFAALGAELARICGRDPDELTGENQMLDSSDDA